VANADVIAAVSETLRQRLTVGLAGLATPAPQAVLDDLTTPPVTTSNPIVTLFLYDIGEDATARNRPKSRRVVGTDVLIRKQPLALTLHYMITAWGGDRQTEQRLLGRALQIFYADATLDGAELQGTLAGSDAELHVSLAPLHLEDRARVWFAIGQTYRLSINYEVRVVNLDVDFEEVAPSVQERRLDAGVPA
jgi:hypothetical protein